MLVGLVSYRLQSSFTDDLRCGAGIAEFLPSKGSLIALEAAPAGCAAAGGSLLLATVPAPGSFCWHIPATLVLQLISKQ